MSSMRPLDSASEVNLDEEQLEILHAVLSSEKNVDDEGHDDDAKESATKIPDFPLKNYAMENFPSYSYFEKLTTGKLANHASSVTSIGVSIAQQVTSSQGVVGLGYAAATGAAVGLSATGIGLIVVGGVLTLVQSAASIRSAIKTSAHIDGLLVVQSKSKDVNEDTKYKCTCLLMEGAQFYIGKTDIINSSGKPDKRSSHDIIIENVLPYIIAKKYAKYYRKIYGAVPVVGSFFELVRAKAKGAYKIMSGTRGVNREKAALWLAYHWMTHNCEAANAIIVEILIRNEPGKDFNSTFESIKNYNLVQLAEALAEKMKST